MGRDAVAQVDDVRLGRDPRDDEVAYADELVAQTQVRDEDHRSAHTPSSSTAAPPPEPAATTVLPLA